MQLNLPDKGLYVIAVSGGVDSVVLLDLLANKLGIGLVVAHYNHGIREDAGEDEELVKLAAAAYGLKFEVGHGKLGANTSEETARNARYEFLRKIKAKHNARAIITAHHQDDLIETAIINLLRGSGRRGLTAISHNAEVIRPLMKVNKEQIKRYAVAHKLKWREDSTNTDPRYLRNYIRQNLMPKFSGLQKQNLLENIDKVAKIKVELDNLIATLSHHIVKSNYIDRSKFASLPLEVENELIAYWLRQNGLRQFDRKTVERVCLGLKTAAPKTEIVVGKRLKLMISAKSAHFSNR